MQTRRPNPVRHDRHAPNQRPDVEAWDENAICKHSENPDAWFPHPTDKEAVDAARAPCGPCPAADACFAKALERREKHGVWGGVLFTSIKSRKRLRDERETFVRRQERAA